MLLVCMVKFNSVVLFFLCFCTVIWICKLLWNVSLSDIWIHCMPLKTFFELLISLIIMVNSLKKWNDFAFHTVQFLTSCYESMLKVCFYYIFHIIKYLGVWLPGSLVLLKLVHFSQCTFLFIACNGIEFWLGFCYVEVLTFHWLSVECRIKR